MSDDGIHAAYEERTRRMNTNSIPLHQNATMRMSADSAPFSPTRVLPEHAPPELPELGAMVTSKQDGHWNRGQSSPWDATIRPGQMQQRFTADLSKPNSERIQQRIAAQEEAKEAKSIAKEAKRADQQFLPAMMHLM